MRHPHTVLRRVLGAVAAATLGIATTLAAQAPASATGCYRSSCNGQDPQGQGCAAGAYDLQSFYYQGSSPWLQGVSSSSDADIADLAQGCVASSTPSACSGPADDRATARPVR